MVNSKKAQFEKREVLSKILKENKDSMSELDVKIAEAYVQGNSLREISAMRGVDLHYANVGHRVNRIINGGKNVTPKAKKGLYSNQKVAVDKIFDMFHYKHQKNVLLHAQMQQGKTGTYLGVIEKYLTAVHGEAVVILSESNNALLGQIKKDAAKLLSPDVLKRVDFRHRSKLKTDTVGTNTALVVIDESHLAASLDQKHGQVLRDILDDKKAPPRKVLLVSATPLREVVKDYFKDNRVVLEETDEYYGIVKMIELGRIRTSSAVFDKKKINTELANQIKDLSKMNKYAIIRVHKEQDAEKLKNFVFKTYPGVKCDIRTRKNKNLEFDFFEKIPLQPTLVIVTGSLRVGKQLDTTHVRFVWDSPESNTDTAVQGLLGRCCGYNKASHNVIIFCDGVQARNYQDVVESGFRAANEVKTNTITVSEGYEQGLPVKTIDLAAVLNMLGIKKEYLFKGHKKLKQSRQLIEGFLKKNYGIESLRNFGEYTDDAVRKDGLRTHAKNKTPYLHGLAQDKNKGATLDPKENKIYILERNKNPILKNVIRRDKPTFSDEIGSV